MGKKIKREDKVKRSKEKTKQKYQKRRQIKRD